MIPALLALSLAASAAQPDLARLKSETRELLKGLIAIDTSNPPGNELPAAEYLKGYLDAAGVPSRILVSTGTRASLLATLKGSGEKQPLILMCHTDVVPADPKEWSTPPFEPVEETLQVADADQRHLAVDGDRARRERKLQLDTEEIARRDLTE